MGSEGDTIALPGLDFRIATGGTSPLSQHPLDLTFLERRSIDLNKHALDLNEAPLNLNCMALHSTAAPFCVEAHNLSMSNFGLSDATAMSLWPSKTGGWLELFRDMFEPGKNIRSAERNSRSIPGTIELNSSSKSSEQLFDRLSTSGKRSRIVEQILLDRPEQLNKRKRVSEQPLYRSFETPNSNKPSQATLFPRIPEQIRNSRTVGHTFFCSTYPHRVLNFPQQTLRPILPSETPRNGSEQTKNTNEFLSVCSERDKGKNRHEQSFHCIPNHSGTSRNLKKTNSHISKQEEKAFTKGLHQTVSWLLPDNQIGVCKSLKEAADDVFANDISSSGCQQALARRSLQENFPSNVEGKLQIRNEEKGATIYKGNGLERSNVRSFSMDIVKDQTPVVQIIESPDWLPANWVTELKVRKTGSTAGTKDKYYREPGSGHRFRSKNEVITYLQTGHMSRYRPRLKHSEDVTPILITSDFIPNQDARSDIHNSTSGRTVPLLDSILGLGADGFEMCKSSVLAKSPESWNAVPKISACQHTGPHNLISAKIAVKEENGVFAGGLGLSCNSTKGLDAPTSVERECIGTNAELSSESKIKKEEGLSMSECTIMGGANQQSAGKAHQRETQLPSFSPGQLFKQSLSGVKNVIRKKGQNIWSTPIDMALQKAVALQLHVRVEANASVTQMKDPLLPYERVRRLNTLQLADISVPSGRFEKMCPGKWPVHSKAFVRKAATLTPRKGRELLVSLGRKICQQYLGSVSETVSHQFK